MQLTFGQPIYLRFDSRRGLGILLFTTASRSAPGPTQPPIQWIPGAFSRDKAAGVWSWPLTSTPQYVFMAWYLVKHRDNFTFTFTFYSILPHPLRYSNSCFARDLFNKILLLFLVPLIRFKCLVNRKFHVVIVSILLTDPYKSQGYS
jgi:hypothetical protein